MKATFDGYDAALQSDRIEGALNDFNAAWSDKRDELHHGLVDAAGVLRNAAEQFCAAGVPEGLWAVLAALLAKDPARRPASTTAAIESLDAVDQEVRGSPAFPPASDAELIAPPPSPAPNTRTTQVRARNDPAPGDPAQLRHHRRSSSPNGCC